MSWNDASELVVGSNGQIYFAPVGTALPALSSSPTAGLNAAFVGAGFLTEDGVTPTVGQTVVDFLAWQSIDPVRSERTAQDKSVAFTLQQWNETNLPFAFGGGSVTDHGSTYSYVFPEADDPLEERSLVVDWQDGDAVHYRLVLARGNVREPVSSQIRRGATALLPVTFKVLRPEDESTSAYLITDHGSFEAGS